jgi:hypothetical protein
VRWKFVDSAIKTTDGPLGLSQTDYALSGRVRAMLKFPMYSIPLRLLSLQPTIRSRYILRDSDGIISERDRATIRSALSCDATNEYLLCFSALSLIVNALKLHVLYYCRWMPSFK